MTCVCDGAYTACVSSLFATVPGLTALLIAVIIIEIFSLLIMWFVILMFRRARLRQKEFFLLLYGIDANADPSTYPEPVRTLVAHIEFPLLLWLYVILTITLTVVTFVIFFFQPHLI